MSYYKKTWIQIFLLPDVRFIVLYLPSVSVFLEGNASYSTPKVICFVQELPWLNNFSPCSLFTIRTQKEIELDNGRVSSWSMASKSWPFPSHQKPFRAPTRWWCRRKQVEEQSTPSLWRNSVWLMENEKDIAF